MKLPDEDKIRSFLVGAMSDGFNRSLRALEIANAINTDEMRTQYIGVGSKYYDIVTEQLEYTAKYAVSDLLELLKSGEESDE